MRIGVVGAGGVGGLVAGLLSRAGHHVSLVARGGALHAIRARGLRIESPLGAFTTPIEVASSPHELAPVDVVLLAVKSFQVEETVATLPPLLAPGAFVVPLQNGVDAARQCAAALGADRVVGGLCHMLSWAIEPGTIQHVGDAPRFTFGAYGSPLGERLEDLRVAFESADLRVQIVDDYPAALWKKFLFIASFGGVGALSRSPAGAWRNISETRRLLVAAFEEVAAVARAKGISCAPELVEETLAFVDRLPATATSSLQRDIMAGRASELESLSGAVVRIGGEVGVPVPVHSTIYGALLPLEHTARNLKVDRA